MRYYLLAGVRSDEGRIYFRCQADDADHAKEQFLNAEPEIVHVEILIGEG